MISKTQRNILIILFSFLIIGIAFLCVLNSRRSSEFVPPSFDANAVYGHPQIPEQLERSVLNVSAGYSVWLCDNIELEGNDAVVYFASPEENTVWLKLRILDENNNILGESGLIKPGEYIKSIHIEDLPQRSKTALKIMAYEPNTYYSMGVVSINRDIKL